VTQGYRLNTAKTGNVARNLIYPKGAYILHMLRMLMSEKKEGDARFQIMMRDFIKTNFNKDVSTEDFKAIVEKHITPKMDIDKNGKMDWFFDQWVYGTEVPAYKLEYSVNKVEGKTVLSGKITQSGVSDNFVMPVPLYLDFGNGWVSVGNVTIVGNKSFDLGNIPLPQEPKKVAINALSDILATSIENVKK
jgi:aminopeptidase N